MLQYRSPSSFVWQDSNGVSHIIRQGEGGEQGDPLMPSLFCLGIHGALEQAGRNLLPSEVLVGYLDDIYVVTCRERARQCYDDIVTSLRNLAGIEVNFGKAECWGLGGGGPPDGILELGSDPNRPVWKGNLASELCGVEALGVPMGSEGFVIAHCRGKAEEQQDFLQSLCEGGIKHQSA